MPCPAVVAQTAFDPMTRRPGNPAYANADTRRIPRMLLRRSVPLLTLLLLLAAPAELPAQTPASSEPLPPALPWNGKSQELIAKPSDPWITPAERAGFQTTPSYDETVAWLKKLVAVTPELRMVSIGQSSEGRDIWMVIASRDRVFTPETMRQIGKPVLLAQCGIHAGEIDGKDAGLMVLRDLTVGKRLHDLLERVNFLFVPIFNPDGHERASRYSRINQRGPENAGWRTNARNLNLNRDYTKVDTPEMRAMLSTLVSWRPDLYLDIHVTDGADYQYDVTFGWNESGYSPRIAKWLEGTFAPAVNTALRNAGHVPGPLIFPVADNDLARGIVHANAPPRFSNGYGDLRHLATVLVENHSLKPYEQRVLGTAVLLESALDTLSRAGTSLKMATTDDSQRSMDPVPLDWRPPQTPPERQETMEFLGVESKTTPSNVSGGPKIEWLGKPMTMRVPVIRVSEVAASVPRAKAYWIPAAWSVIAIRMLAHGIMMERMSAPRDVGVDIYRLEEPKLATEAFEGRVRLETKTTKEHVVQHFPAGSWRVPTDQPLGELITVLLEPASADSYLQWGFFPEILQRTEYFEPYILEPLASQMLAADPKLAEEFQKKLDTDPAFKASAEERLRFFYERSPYFDRHWRLYPVARER
jgi:murein tripeptide amidase MpaA